MAEVIGGGRRSGVSDPVSETTYEPPPQANPDPVRAVWERQPPAPPPVSPISEVATLLDQGYDAWTAQRAQGHPTPERHAPRVRGSAGVRGAAFAPALERPMAQIARPPRQAPRPVVEVFDEPDDLAPAVAPGLSWRQQYYVYSVMFALFAIVWIADGVFTVAGLMLTIMPQNIIGLVIAVGFHLLASWGQRSLIHDPSITYRLAGVVLLLTNVESTKKSGVQYHKWVAERVMFIA